jgi:hypothetical protein
MELTADTGLRLAIFTTAPGSRSEEALNLLASRFRPAAASASHGANRAAGP